MTAIKSELRIQVTIVKTFAFVESLFFVVDEGHDCLQLYRNWKLIAWSFPDVLRIALQRGKNKRLGRK